MNERTKQRAGTLVAAILAADGLLHAYWATGARWPAHDERSLSRAVLNADVPFTPIVVGPLACLLLLGAAMALARVDRLGRFGRRIPDPVPRFGILVVVTGLLARAAAGIAWVLTADTETTFYRLNATVYTPACLVLFAAAVTAARSERAEPGGVAPLVGDRRRTPLVGRVRSAAGRRAGAPVREAR